MHPGFFKHHELFELKNWHKSDKYTQEIFSWLPELFPNKNAYCMFFLEYPSDDFIATVPKNHDAYIIHTGTEYVDWAWLKRFCDAFVDSQVVFLTPYDTSLYRADNLHLLEYHVWPKILEIYFRELNPKKISLHNRHYRLSALCNRINEARCYIGAHLLRTWRKEDFVMSWKGYLGKPEDLYFLEPCGIQQIDALKKYIATDLLSTTIDLDGDFVNRPLDNMFTDWAPYNDCVINCSNESVSVSKFFDNTMPGPYLTEKTWKILISGTGLLPVGQYGTYRFLEKFGFEFDYPWDKKFDEVPEDFFRFMMIMDNLDRIRDMDLGELDHETRASRSHNQDHIFSGDFFKVGHTINEQGINRFRL